MLSRAAKQTPFKFDRNFHTTIASHTVVRYCVEHISYAVEGKRQWHGAGVGLDLAASPRGVGTLRPANAPQRAQLRLRNRHDAQPASTVVRRREHRLPATAPASGGRSA